MISFAGVFLTVISGSTANFRLADKRAEIDRSLANQKLNDERQARAADLPLEVHNVGAIQA